MGEMADAVGEMADAVGEMVGEMEQPSAVAKSAMPHSRSVARTLAARYSDATDCTRQIGEPSALIGDLSASDQSLLYRPCGCGSHIRAPIDRLRQR